MKQGIALVVLLIGLIAASVFAFLQTRSLEALQTNSTQAVSALRASSTQALGNAIATETTWANGAYATHTQAADDIKDAAATGTAARFEFAFSLETSTEAANQVLQTGTRLADNAFATATALVDTANQASTKAAAILATEIALGTESAHIISNQYAQATNASYQEATLQAQNLMLSGTVEASGWAGQGFAAESAPLPDGFETFSGDNFEIALPESFDGTGLNNAGRFFRRLDSMGLEQSREYLQAQDENFLFFAIDITLIDQVPRATVSLIRDIPAIESNLSDYLNGAYIGSSTLLMSDILPVNGQAVGRSILQQSFANGMIRQMQYIFEFEGAFYILTYSAPIDEFLALLPVFEASAETLRIRN